MTTIHSFVNRLKKVGVDVAFIGNYPWIYLDTVNGKKVEGSYLANHGFTAFWLGKSTEGGAKITDISMVFNKIRETINK